MNANLVKYGIIAGAVLGAVGIGYGGYKGTKALRRRSAAKRAAAQATARASAAPAAEAAQTV
ncbi:hypothetical protein [Burkholderia phage FLC9]|nr:hypothetical protein [Burkholderia phage FLC9]